MSNKICMIPYKRNPVFVGRESILTDLSVLFIKQSTPPTIVALEGIPGIGKTEIALEYAYRSWPHYQAIIWLNATSRHHLVEQIIQILETGGETSLQVVDQALVFDLFRTWLSQRAKHCLCSMTAPIWVCSQFYWLRRVVRMYS